MLFGSAYVSVGSSNFRGEIWRVTDGHQVLFRLRVVVIRCENVPFFRQALENVQLYVDNRQSESVKGKKNHVLQTMNTSNDEGNSILKHSNGLWVENLRVDKHVI